MNEPPSALGLLFWLLFFALLVATAITSALWGWPLSLDAGP